MTHGAISSSGVRGMARYGVHSIACAAWRLWWPNGQSPQLQVAVGFVVGGSAHVAGSYLILRARCALLSFLQDYLLPLSND